MTTSITTITTGQRKQVKRFAEDAIDQVFSEGSIDKEGIQKLIEHGDEFQADIVASIKKHSLNNQYADEETESKYGYLSGYKPEGEDLDRQITILQGLFPGLGSVNSDYLQKIKSGEIKVPKQGEKFFAIPNIWKPGGLAIFGSTYSQALQMVLDKIKETRNGNFYNYREGEIDEKHIRQTIRTVKDLQELSVAQGNPDILIVSAQFGIRHRGRSVRRAREIFATNEFGLGTFSIGIMILTHPERLQHYDDLYIGCAGDEFSYAGDGVFDEAPYCSFFGVKVWFGADWVSDTCDRGGSASGFSPQ